MNLSIEEQRLITEFRTLGAAAQDDALSYVTALARHAVSEQDEAAAGQCSIKTEARRPETDKEPIFTE